MNRTDILQRILATKAEEVVAAQRARPFAEVAGAPRAQCRRPATSTARCARRSPPGAPAVIAEIKKASPSKGVLRDDLRPAGDRGELRGAAAPPACRC